MTDRRDKVWYWCEKHYELYCFCFMQWRPHIGSWVRVHPGTAKTPDEFLAERYWWELEMEKVGDAHLMESPFTILLVKQYFKRYLAPSGLMRITGKLHTHVEVVYHRSVSLGDLNDLMKKVAGEKPLI